MNKNSYSKIFKQFIVPDSNSVKILNKCKKKYKNAMCKNFARQADVENSKKFRNEMLQFTKSKRTPIFWVKQKDKTMETWQGTTTEEQLKTIMLTSTNKLNLYILLLE